jgi:hypothetical protein
VSGVVASSTHATFLRPPAGLIAAALRAHAAATEAGRKERTKVWGRCARAAGLARSAA